MKGAREQGCLLINSVEPLSFSRYAVKINMVIVFLQYLIAYGEKEKKLFLQYLIGYGEKEKKLFLQYFIGHGEKEKKLFLKNYALKELAGAAGGYTWPVGP